MTSFYTSLCSVNCFNALKSLQFVSNNHVQTRESSKLKNDSINLSEGKNIKVILKETLNLSSDRETQTDYRSLIEKCLKCPYLNNCEVSTLILLDPKQRNPIDNLLDLRQFCLFYNKLSYESCEFFNYDCSKCGVKDRCEKIKKKLDEVFHKVTSHYPEFMQRKRWYFKDKYNERLRTCWDLCQEYCHYPCKKWNWLIAINTNIPERVLDQWEEILLDIQEFLKWKIERCIYVRLNKVQDKMEESYLKEMVRDAIKELNNVRKRVYEWSSKDWKEYFRMIYRTGPRSWKIVSDDQSMDSEVI